MNEDLGKIIENFESFSDPLSRDGLKFSAMSVSMLEIFDLTNNEIGITL